jgi:SAM-dependent methyltransferase
VGVHQAAARGFARESEAYDRGRPGYPVELTAWLRQALRVGPGAAAVDLGAGTGKFTALLADTGAEVIAVEPLAEMRQRLQARLPGVEALPGTAEAIPLPDRSADAVACAQSFHWFANRAALGEIRRVLKPGGRLGLVWNIMDETTDWARAIVALYNRWQGDAPRRGDIGWRDLFPAEGFGPLHEASFHHFHRGPPEQVLVDRIRSVSFIAALPPPQQAQVLDEVRRLIAEASEVRGKIEVSVPYTTEVYWCEKR